MVLLPKNPQVLVITLVPHDEDVQKKRADADEIASLVETYGALLSASFTQNAARGDSGTYIGTGKAHELTDYIIKHDIDIVVINGNLTASQLFNLKTIWEEGNPQILVWDRVDLILEIFKKHATSAEAKLQIKLAEVRHKGPELHGSGKLMSQQGAGIGTRGMGETNSEIMRRHWRGEIKQIEKELAKMTSVRTQQMAHRKEIGLATISIVGYTNAGKTTLFNRLSKKHNLVENALFATLDSSVGKLYLPVLEKEAFITDTIGFIQNLPHDLIQAFKSTLLETVNADLLLHIIDSTDPQMVDKIAVVESILKDLNIDSKKQLYVFNKMEGKKEIDRQALTKQYAPFKPQFISALTGTGLPQLIKVIQANLKSFQ
jgi:GTPase